MPPTPDVDPSLNCDPFLQDCPEGEKCVLYSSVGGGFDGNKCVPVLGEQATGEPCTYSGSEESTDDCDATGFCWNVTEVDGQLVGVCHAFCEGTPDTPECPEGTNCSMNGSGGPALCVSLCDPVAQDCDPPTACHWDAGDFTCVIPIADYQPGEPCGYINDCAQGSDCIAADALPECYGAACCTPWCALGQGDAQCAAVPGTACVPFFEDGKAPPGYEHVGVCILPP